MSREEYGEVSKSLVHWHQHDVLTLGDELLHSIETIHVYEQLLDARSHDSAEVP